MNTQTFIIPGASNKSIGIDLLTPDDENSSSMVIFVHGFKGFKDWGTHHLTASYFVDRGFNFLKFNFSHNGISEKGKDTFDELNAFAENTFSKQLFDLDEVITFALSGEKFKAPKKVFLVGHSLGGGISIIQTAEDKRINKIATWASICRFNKLWSPEQENEWRNNGVIYTQNSRTKQNMPLNLSILEDFERNSEHLEIDSAGKNIVQPWLIVHGEADPGVSVEQAFELHRQNKNSKLLLIPEGDHVFGARHPWNEPQLPEKLRQVCDATIDFFLSN